MAEAKVIAKITTIRAVGSIIIKVAKSLSTRRWEAGAWVPLSSKPLMQIETLGSMTDLRSSWKSNNGIPKVSRKVEETIITLEHKVRIVEAFTRVQEKEASKIFRSSLVI